MKMDVICTDNRFELIQKYKEKLIQGTNIETQKRRLLLLIIFYSALRGSGEALKDGSGE